MSLWADPGYWPPIFRGIIQGDVMDFQVLSRMLMAKTAYEDRDYIVISIADPGQRNYPEGDWGKVVVPESPRRLGVIELDFHDIDEPLSDCTLMSEEQARQVVEWIQGFAPKDDEKWPLIVVHCEAGMCRSSGLAAALSKFWNGSDDFFWDEQQSGFLPNKWVYAQMSEALHV
jgi:hypothetical protein